MVVAFILRSNNEKVPRDSLNWGQVDSHALNSFLVLEFHLLKSELNLLSSLKSEPLNVKFAEK